MACRALRPPSGLRDGADPVADRRRRASRSRSSASIGFPKVDFPTVVVTTVQPGAAPEQIETEITDKIEEAVNTISGIDELARSRPRASRMVFIAFLLEKDIERRRPGGARQGQRRAAAPAARRSSSRASTSSIPDAAPVLSIALSANKPVREVTEFADKVLRRQLESVTGVGQVLVLGGRERQINVWLDADRLRAYNLTVTDVSRALQAQNIEVPGGRVEQGPQSRHAAHARPGAVGRGSSTTSSSREKDGHPVRVGDVAGSRTARPSPRRSPTSTATPTVLLQVRKQSGTNTVEVVDGGRERLDELQSDAARRLRRAGRPRPVRVHRGVDPQRRGAPDPRLDPRRARRAAVPRQPALDHHRRDRDPDVDHRDLRARSGTWASRSTPSRCWR